MNTASYTHAPGNTVYWVSSKHGVKAVLILTVTIDLTSTSTTVRYLCQKESITDLEYNISEYDIFADVDAALAEYKTRYLTP